MSEHREEAEERGTARFGTADWWIYRGTGRPRSDIQLDTQLPPPPPWRTFNGGPLPADDTPPEDDGEMVRRLGPANRMTRTFVEPHEIDMINAALCLRRPLLLTGAPGTGKSTLAYQIARELCLGRVLRWHITSYTKTSNGLYGYDAIGRAQAISAVQAAGAAAALGAGAVLTDESLGDFVRLGPLGTAFLPSRLPRVLLIDELDKSESDLPNDLLGVFEDGEFSIPELERVRGRTPEISVFTDDPGQRVTVVGGRVRCRAFPVIVITSNGERDFPPAFLRRCLQLEMRPPGAEKLADMVVAHLGDKEPGRRTELVAEFVRMSERTGSLPADRLLDAMYLATSGRHDPESPSWPVLLDALWRQLTTSAV